VAAEKAAKYERIYREQASGGRSDRRELERLTEAKAGFRSLTEAIRYHHAGRTHDDARWSDRLPSSNHNINKAIDYLERAGYINAP
jgi:hypothetical protein